MMLKYTREPRLTTANQNHAAYQKHSLLPHTPTSQPVQQQAETRGHTTTKQKRKRGGETHRQYNSTLKSYRSSYCREGATSKTDKPKKLHRHAKNDPNTASPQTQPNTDTTGRLPQDAISRIPNPLKEETRRHMEPIH